MDLAAYTSFWGTRNLRRWRPEDLAAREIPAQARDFLAVTGLPSNNFYFQFGPEYDQLPPVPSDPTLLAFGMNTFPERPFCLEQRSGRVYMLFEGTRVFCNSSVEKFAECVTERERCRKLALIPSAKGGYLGRLAELAVVYERRLREIDPPAFASVDALWPGSVEDMRDEADQ